MLDPNAINDQQPSDDAMDRLWDALDAALDPPAPTAKLTALRAGRPGACHCLRCGYAWDPHPSNPHPHGCPHCHTCYWDRPPKKANARRPENTDWAAELQVRAERNAARRRNRHLVKVKELADTLGLDITDPRSGRRVAHTRANAKVLRQALPADLAPITMTTEIRQATPATVLIRETFVRGRTVPPPPGLEDLEGTK